LIETLENAGRGVGITKAGIERVSSGVNEINVAIGISKHSLVFPAVLKIGADFQRMISDQLAEVIDDVKGPIVIKEGGVVGAVVGSIGYSPAVKIELRNIVLLDRARKESRQAGQPV
jgi:hypothetical protein